MKERLTQTLAQRQQQTLSPSQVRFVRLLEMNGPEIEEEVRRELDDNPALEVVEKEVTPAEPFGESAEQLQLADYRSEDDIPSYRFEARNHSAGGDGRPEPVAVESGLSLYDSLMEQLGHSGLDNRDIEIARYIAGNIDDNGYMTRSLASIADDIAVTLGLDVSDEYIRSIYDKVRELDPPGVGATDLRDCLLLQLRRRPRSEAVDNAIEIVAHYFDLFSLKHYDRLRSALGITTDQLRDAVEVITSLNPKPGSALEGGGSDMARQVYPDFNVEVDGDDITLTLLNNIPDLQIESTFATDDDVDAVVAETRRQRDARAFIRARRDDAASFIRLLKMRQATLYRVMSAIVKLQRRFFITGDESDLRPMILKDVAAITGDDLSVISRVTAGKYVATASGVYPLKFFFNERHNDDDDDASTHEILAAIRSIVDSEQHSSPLSDEAITRLLSDRGYRIARRTVTKYRERLGIPVARLRRRLE